MTQSVTFDRAVEYYDKTRGFPPGEEAAVAALIAQAGNLNPAKRVIEIGVGTGRIALPLVSYTAAYIGLDLSRPMMEKLRAKQDSEPISLIEGDATRLPFATGSFDAAVVVHVFHLIPNWRDALTELARVLRPGAPLIHCWTQDDDVFGKVWDVWNKAVPASDQRVGAHWQKNPNFLEAEGWRPINESQTHTYAVPKTINKFLSMLRERCWSALWNSSDEELSRGLEAVEPLIQAEYPDRDRLLDSFSTFYARAYVPPE